MVFSPSDSAHPSSLSISAASKVSACHISSSLIAVAGMKLLPTSQDCFRYHWFATFAVQRSRGCSWRWCGLDACSRGAARAGVSAANQAATATAMIKPFLNRSSHVRALTSLAVNAPGNALIVLKRQYLAGFRQPLRRRLRCDIPLRRPQQFIADHEFLHRRGTQQRRKVVRMKMPFRMSFSVRRALMEAHRIRKRSLKHVIVASRDPAQNISQQISFAC